jgi:hypothetical protein
MTSNDVQYGRRFFLNKKILVYLRFIKSITFEESYYNLFTVLFLRL